MKKILLSLAALALSASAAFAQSAPFISGVTFSVTDPDAVVDIDDEENIFELNTPEVTLSMEFNGWNKAEADTLGYSPKLMVATGMGFVKENVNKSAINELPAGLYIVDGKKYIVR